MRRSTLIFILSIVFMAQAAEYNRSTFYQAFLQSDLSEWHDFIADKLYVSNDSLLLILDLEYNYLAWASTQDIDDNQQLLGQFNRHISRYESLATGNKTALSDFYTFRSASHVYSVSILNKSNLSHSLQAITAANRACEKPTARALMHQGFMYFYRPDYAGGSKEEALEFLRKAEKGFLRQKNNAEDWNLRNTQMHIAQCLIKLGRHDEARQYINQILKEEPNFKFLKEL